MGPSRGLSRQLVFVFSSDGPRDRGVDSTRGGQEEATVDARELELRKRPSKESKEEGLEKREAPSASGR